MGLLEIPGTLSHWLSFWTERGRQGGGGHGAVRARASQGPVWGLALALWLPSAGPPGDQQLISRSTGLAACCCRIPLLPPWQAPHFGWWVLNWQAPGFTWENVANFYPHCECISLGPAPRNQPLGEPGLLPSGVAPCTQVLR